MQTTGFPLSSWTSSSCHENVSGPHFGMGSAGLSKKTFRYPGSCPVAHRWTVHTAAFLGPGAPPIAYLHRLCDKKVWVARKWDVCGEKYSSPSGSEHVHLAESKALLNQKCFSSEEWSPTISCNYLNKSALLWRLDEWWWCLCLLKWKDTHAVLSSKKSDYPQCGPVCCVCSCAYKTIVKVTYSPGG